MSRVTIDNLSLSYDLASNVSNIGVVSSVLSIQSGNNLSLSKTILNSGNANVTIDETGITLAAKTITGDNVSFEVSPTLPYVDYNLGYMSTNVLYTIAHSASDYLALDYDMFAVIATANGYSHTQGWVQGEKVQLEKYGGSHSLSANATHIILVSRAVNQFPTIISKTGVQSSLNLASDAHTVIRVYRSPLPNTMITQDLHFYYDWTRGPGVGYNDANGTMRVIDQSGNGNDGTSSGLARPAIDLANMTFAYSNTISNLVFTNNRYSYGNDFQELTEAVWFKKFSSTDNVAQCLVQFSRPAAQETTGIINYDRMLYIGYDNDMYWGVYDGADKVAGSINTVTDGRWHYAVGTASRSTGIIQLYIDGVLQSSNTITKMGIGTDVGPGVIRIGHGRLGAWPLVRSGANTSANPAYSGNIAAVQVYTRALDANEVLQNFNAMRGRYGV